MHSLQGSLANVFFILSLTFNLVVSTLHHPLLLSNGLSTSALWRRAGPFQSPFDTSQQKPRRQRAQKQTGELSELQKNRRMMELYASGSKPSGPGSGIANENRQTSAPQPRTHFESSRRKVKEPRRITETKPKNALTSKRLRETRGQEPQQEKISSPMPKQQPKNIALPRESLQYRGRHRLHGPFGSTQSTSPRIGGTKLQSLQSDTSSIKTSRGPSGRVRMKQPMSVAEANRMLSELESKRSREIQQTGRQDSVTNIQRLHEGGVGLQMLPPRRLVGDFERKASGPKSTGHRSEPHPTSRLEERPPGIASTSLPKAPNSAALEEDREFARRAWQLDQQRWQNYLSMIVTTGVFGPPKKKARPSPE